MQHLKSSTLLLATTAVLNSFCIASPELSNSSVNALNGSITGNNTSNVTVNLNDAQTVLNWNNLSTAELERVTFNMQSNGRVLNLISGPRTVFNGFLTANQGSVFMVNPNGITFGSNAIVNVSNGSFVASSLTITPEDFDNSNYQFTAGTDKGVIINSGTIIASHVGLIGNSVVNQGTINAFTLTGSSASLIAGEAVTMTFDSSGLMQFEITEAVTENLNDPASNNNAIEHSSGRISASHVLLSAKTAAGIFDQAINSNGKLEAKAISNQGGIVRLISEGPANGQDISVNLDKVESSVDTIIISIPDPVDPTPAPTNPIVDGGETPPATDGNTEQPTTPTPPETIVAQQEDEPQADLNTLNANNGAPGNDNNVVASTSTSLGLYSVEDSGIRLPADQQDEF